MITMQTADTPPRDQRKNSSTKAKAKMAKAKAKTKAKAKAMHNATMHKNKIEVLNVVSRPAHAVRADPLIYLIRQ